MKSKKLTGYKLTKAYPGSPAVGTEVGANDKMAPLLTDHYTPIYKQEEKSSTLVLGSNSIRFVITSGRVFDDTHGNEVDMYGVEELLENIQNLRDCEIGNYDVFVREDWRWIRIGCQGGNNRFSPDEIEKLYDEYKKMNR